MVEEEELAQAAKAMKGTSKKTLKGTIKKWLIIAGIAYLIICFLIASCYLKFKKNFEELTKKSSKYSVSVSKSGNLKYTKTNKDGSVEEITIEDMAKDYEEILEEYIDSEEYNEKIEYLINAEVVTKMPYIDGVADGELNGNIKFYRYQQESDSKGVNLKESNRLRYKELNDFQSMVAEGNEEVYKYFTINDEGTVLIAYGTHEWRTIETGHDNSEKDQDLTLDIVKEKSGEDRYEGSYKKGFSMEEIVIYTKPIDYTSIVEEYTMPLNLLYALLVQTNSIEFVQAIAELAYESEIAIGIYDNTSHTVNTEVYTYQKLLEMDIDTKAKVPTNIVDIPGSESSSTIKYDPIKIGNSDIGKSPYNLISVECKATTENGEIKHWEINSDGNKVEEKKGTNYTYITSMEGNKVTGIGKEESALGFKTKYTRTVDAMSIPTVGIVMSDTWIARWDAAYEREEETKPGNSSEVELDDSIIAEYPNKTEMLNCFGGEFKQDVTDKLNNHAEKLKEGVVDGIISKTPDEIFKVEAVEYTMNNAWKDYKEQIKLYIKTKIVQYIIKSDYRSEILAHEWENTIPSLEFIEELYQALAGGTYKGTLVRDDIEQNLLKSYVDAENNKRKQEAIEKEAELRAEFEKQVNNNISYNQNMEGNKNYVEIINNYEKATTYSKYERSETVSMSKDGQKFAEIFNNKEFYNEKQAILKRQAWLFEYIRENEDTSKLEDILRYLLNIATDSEEFGDFTDEDIESLFQMFEPQELQSFTSTGGGIGKYLAQFGGNNTQYEIDGALYYKMYNDSAGNPTIGPGDIQWVSNHGRFNETGTVIYGGEGGTTYSNCNVKQKVNELLGPDGNNTKWEGKENPPESESIYIDVETVDRVTDDMQSVYLEAVIAETSGINLSRQQLYALTYIKYSTGNLSIVAIGENEATTKTFTQVYNEALNEGEANSWKFNKYIWENWWSTKWASGYAHGREYAGWLKGRDASFETYVKGTTYFGGNSVFGRDSYTYYSKEDILKIGFSETSNHAKMAKRNENNSEEIFTYVVASGTYTEVNDEYIHGTYTSASGKTYKEWKQTNNKYGAKQVWDWGSMMDYGCGVYSMTMLLNSVGIETTPEDVRLEFNDNGKYVNTMNKMLAENNKTCKVVSQNNKADFISRLQEGYGFMTYMKGPSLFTDSKHWIVIVDIRTTELDSASGYDVYVLTSTSGGRGWQKLDTIEEYLFTPQTYGYCIVD